MTTDIEEAVVISEGQKTESEEPKAPQNSRITTLPSIDALFRESWEVLKSVMLKLFLLTIFSIVLTFIILAILGVIIAVAGAGPAIMSFIQTRDPEVFTQLFTTPSFWVVFGIAMTMWIVFAVFMNMIMQTAMLLVIGKSQEEDISVGKAISTSWSLLIPLFVVQLISGFLVLGSMFLLVIPGLIVSIMLSFTMYEVILNGQTGMNALKRSSMLVTKYFGDIFVRWLAIVGVYVGMAIIPPIIERIVPSLEGVISLIFMIPNVLFGWFMAVYWTLLYKHLIKGNEKAEGSSIGWCMITAVIGWIIGVLVIGAMIFGLVMFAQSGKMEELFNRDTFNQSIEGEYPGTDKESLDSYYPEGDYPDETGQWDETELMKEFIPTPEAY